MKKLLFFLILICFFPSPVLAEESPDRTQEIWQETLQELQQLQVPGVNLAETAEKAAEGSFSFRFDSALQYVLGLLLGEVKENTDVLIKILVLSVLAGVLCNLQQAMPGWSGVADISFVACFAVIAGFSVTIISDLSDLAVSAIDSLTILIAGLMPIMNSLTLSAASSAVTGFYPGLFLAMQSFIVICRNILLPLIMVISSLSVVNALSSRFHITRLIDFARQTVKWGLGLLLTVFVGILSIHSLTAASATVAGRTVKYALCSFVPLVGNVLAESAEAVVSSLHLIKSTVGITGILALLTVCCLPLVKILAVSVLYRFAAGVAEPATDKRIIRLLMDLSGNITLIFVILLMAAVMFLISLGSLLLLTV